ncbi:MAG: MBL fold metallo-hydrolase, partial [Brevundimonas sp.]|nr:MBL fold metallo-hydrolase [Brevundimonas sp.]
MVELPIFTCATTVRGAGTRFRRKQVRSARITRYRGTSTVALRIVEMSASRTIAGTLAAATLLYSAAASAQAQAPAPSVVVHRQVSVPAAYNANAYWLESDSGIVLIDALMLRSDAHQLVAAMKETGKPLAGIILTHPHLDHFGGIRTVREAFGDVPVIATQATADGIKPAYD